MELSRPSWDSIWIGLASSLAKRSTCGRSSVGCVVVTLDNCHVLSVGYNGSAKGLDNECLSSEPGKCGHLHSEINCLIKMNYNPLVEKKMYVTLSPCRECAVAIVNAGISEVIYRDAYRKTDGADLLFEAGIKVTQYAKEDKV